MFDRCAPAASRPPAPGSAGTGSTMTIDRLDRGPHPDGDRFCLIEAAAAVAGGPGGDNPPGIPAFLRILGRRLNDAVDDEVRATFLPYVTAIARADRDDHHYADRALRWTLPGPLRTLLTLRCGADVAAAHEHLTHRHRDLRAASAAQRTKAAGRLDDAFLAVQALIDAEHAYVTALASCDDTTAAQAAERLIAAGRTCEVTIDLDLPRPPGPPGRFHLHGLRTATTAPLTACPAIVHLPSHPDTIPTDPPAGLLEALLS